MICKPCQQQQHAACRDCPCAHKDPRVVTGSDDNLNTSESEST